MQMRSFLQLWKQKKHVEERTGLGEYQRGVKEWNRYPHGGNGERTLQVCTMRMHRLMAAAQVCWIKFPLFSHAFYRGWRWSSGSSFSWKLCWKITELLPHCSKSSLWSVSPWGQAAVGAGDSLHKAGKLWEAGSLVQTWHFILANLISYKAGL